MSILVKIDSCKQCHYFKKELTKGYGYAEDWCCTKSKGDSGRWHGLKVIGGYIEWKSEEPKDIPKWCPLHRRKYNQ